MTTERGTKEAWRISDFTKKLLDDMTLMFPDERISYHFNIIDGWFKELEKRGLHYVNRAGGEKLYDGLDLNIAKFIFLKRREKWALDMIFEELPDVVELRPFPPEGAIRELPKTFDEMVKRIKTEVKNELKHELVDEVKKEIRLELKENFEEKLKNQWKQILIEERKLLDNPEYAKEKERKMQERIMRIQIRANEELEREAIEEWNKLDEKIRMIKPGIFAKKVENASAKMDFIQKYKNERMKSRIQNLLNQEEGDD